MKNPVSSLRVAPGKPFSLGEHDTDATFGWDKDDAKAELEKVTERLDALQYRLYAEAERSMLIVLQAMDAAGKDGTIRHVLSGLNPAGFHVTPFGVPGGEEVEHDYLWRIHHHVPRKGTIGVFNRSHYEDVLVVRVKSIVPKKVWSRRFDHINHFEQMLVDEGTTVVKLFLNVSKDEQRKRLQERVDNPEKQWKFRAGDLEDRKLWDDFQRAYEDTIQRTATASAPWYVVPADRNWVRNLAVGKIILHHLEKMDPQLPEPEDDPTGVIVP